MILDIVNMIYVLTILLIIQRYYNIKKLYLIIILFHALSIFLFNGLIFEATYMPDQFSYLKVTRNIRDFDFFNEENFLSGNTVYVSSIIFGLFPIPFINSVHSIGMINFLFYLYVFLFMYRKGFLQSKMLTYFYLLYPSLLLYSSVALRDMLIFVVMFFGTYFILIKKQNLVGFTSLFFLTFIKVQNLLIFIVSFVLGSFFSRKINLKYIVFSLFSFLTVFILFTDYFSVESINHYRSAFYHENIQKTNEPFIAISSYYELLYSSLPSALKFMFRPLPWEEFGVFQALQFIENCAIVFLILWIMYKNIKYKLLFTHEVKLLNILLLIALIVYGLVSYNSGTAVRYKFPFITIYLIFSYYYIYRIKNKIIKIVNNEFKNNCNRT